MVGNIPLHAGHSGIDPRAGTTDVDAAKISHFTHKGWSVFFGWGITRNGFACQASVMCSLSGHVASAAVGEGLTSTVILPMSMSLRVALSSWVPAAAASFSAARVVLLDITCATAPTHGGVVCVVWPWPVLMLKLNVETKPGMFIFNSFKVFLGLGNQDQNRTPMLANTPGSQGCNQ